LSILCYSNLYLINTITAIVVSSLICILVNSVVVIFKVAIIVLKVIANIAFVVIIFVYCFLKVFTLFGIFCIFKGVLASFTL